MTGSPPPPRPIADALIEAAGRLLAAGGIASVTAEAVGDASGHGAAAVGQHFTDVDHLLVATATSLARSTAIEIPDGHATATSIEQTLGELTAEYRAHVDEAPWRFRALLQIAAGAFGSRELTAPLAARHRRTLAATRAHFALLHRGGLTTVATSDLIAIAARFVDTAQGIEMCHLLDDDEALRIGAYDALQSTLEARLGRPPIDHGTDHPRVPSMARMTFDPGFRLTLVLEPEGTVRDVLHVSGVRRWDARLYLGRPLTAVANESTVSGHREPAWPERIAAAHVDPGPTAYHDRRPGQSASERPLTTCTITPVRSRGGDLGSILVDIHDGTPQQEAEDGRREAQEQLSSALELTGLGRYTAYIREPRMDSNARFRAIYGLDPQTLMEEEGFEGFFDVIHAEDRPKVRAALTAAMTGDVDYIASYRLWARRPDGPELRFIEALGRVDFDEEGPLRVVGVVDDVTDRRRSQEAQLRMQKREAVGTLAAGIAHDFNNAIGAVLANAEVAEREVGTGGSPADSLAEIVRGSKRAAALVRRLLASTSDAEPERQAFDVTAVIAEACALIRPAVGSDVELRESPATWVPQAIGDPGQLHQVLINLIANASHAIGGRPGVIEVSVEPHQISTAERDDEDDHLPNGTYLRIVVRDDGPGISERIQPRIFDPFFTTKPLGEGSGLGLASTQSIVTNHGGTITVESEPGLGATFTIIWPTPPLPRPAGDDHPAAAPPEGHVVRVLMIDDEVALTELAKRAMPAFRCIAVVHSDAAEGIAAFEAAPDDFDVVITDLAMPGLTGLEVTRRIRELRPQLPVILTSGFLTPEARTQARRLHVTQIVAKPWSIADLSGVVHELASAERR